MEEEGAPPGRLFPREQVVKESRGSGGWLSSVLSVKESYTHGILNLAGAPHTPFRDKFSARGVEDPDPVQRPLDGTPRSIPRDTSF